jgi:hypothetical protein
MFVPVACLRCSTLFQVPPAAAGTDVTCPWCRELTPALPVAAAGPTPPLPATPSTPDAQPLSLDDAEPLPPAPGAAHPTPRKKPSPAKVAAVAFGMLALGALTVAVLGFKSGRVGSGGWVEFQAPDGSFAAAFPWPPEASKVEPNPLSAVTRGGEEHAASGWYSGVTVYVGYQDLDPAWAKSIAEDKDGALAGPVLEAERDRRLKEHGGAVVPGQTKVVRTTDGRGFEITVEGPRGKRVERYVLVAAGSRPRLYVAGVEGPKLDPDGALVQRVFTRFRVNP